MKPGRVPCCVPFCGRTSKATDADDEVMCGRHYRLARPALRRQLTRVRRRYRAAVLRKDWAAVWSLWRLDRSIWEAIKREATEVAVGIAA
jgi:hypothetical protein